MAPLSDEYWIYETKCRRCNKINEYIFGRKDFVGGKLLNEFIVKHSTFPKMAQCNCYNGGMTIQDIVSHNKIH